MPVDGGAVSMQVLDAVSIFKASLSSSSTSFATEERSEVQLDIAARSDRSAAYIHEGGMHVSVGSQVPLFRVCHSLSLSYISHSLFYFFLFLSQHKTKKENDRTGNGNSNK